MASLGRVNSPCYGCGSALGPTIPFVKRASVVQLLRVKRTALKKKPCAVFPAYINEICLYFTSLSLVYPLTPISNGLAILFGLLGFATCLAVSARPTGLN
jgi:hypothetical protein